MARNALAVRVLASVLALSPAGIAFIEKHEGGAVQRGYLDSIKKPTVCVGHTRNVDMSRFYTKAECAELLREDSDSAQAAVRRAIKVHLYQSEYDALVDFCFNVGNAACSGSTMFKLINRGEYAQAALQFPVWDKVTINGRKVSCRVRSNNCYGVYLRRLDEQALFTSEH